MLYVWSETACTDYDSITLILVKCAWEAEQLKCLFECDGLKTLVLLQLCETRLVLVLCTTDLHNRTETAYLYRYRLVALRVLTQNTLTCLMLRT